MEKSELFLKIPGGDGWREVVLTDRLSITSVLQILTKEGYFGGVRLRDGKWEILIVNQEKR